MALNYSKFSTKQLTINTWEQRLAVAHCLGAEEGSELFLASTTPCMTVETAPVLAV